MWRLILIIFFLTLQIQEGFCVTQWNKGAPAATDLKSIWPTTSQANNSILDSLISNYQRALFLTYSSSSTIIATSGEIVVSNSTGTIRLFLVASTSTNITSTNIDTGSIASSTTYYVYAGTSTATDAAPTFYISLSSTAPSGVTYYALIGQFTTDSSSQFTSIENYNSPNGWVGPSVSKSSGTTYQALTDGKVTAYGNQIAGPGELQCVTDSNSSPSYIMDYQNINANTGNVLNVSCTIQKGNYWKVYSPNGSLSPITVTWQSTSF